MKRQRLWAPVAVAVVLFGTGGAVLAARTGGGVPAADPATAPAAAESSLAPVRVIVPGAPGESASVTDSDAIRAPDGTPYNTVDATFVQMMIAHHTQAVRMADLAAERAAHPQVKAIATRISAAQGPEIEVLRAWLAARRLPEHPPGHDHADMPGMQSEAAVAELTAARGGDFDRRFVAMMTAHHRGAQRMAGDVLRAGSDPLLAETANEMAVEQVSEIRRMAQIGMV